MFIIPAPADIAFKVFNFPVYWYGITMALAILTGAITANKLFNKIWSQDAKDIIIEYAPLMILFGILGARIYFCCLNPEFYFSHPLEIFNIREGGLSIHGGIIGGILGIILMSYRSKISFWKLIDSLSCGIILGQAIGRWGNYFNSEAYGLPIASQNWGLYIPLKSRIPEFANYKLFHPTFLYESILDICAFIILIYIFNRFGRKYNSLTFFAYLILYSVIRFFMEFLRVDSALNIGTIHVAQIASIMMFFIGAIGIINLFIKTKSIK